MNFPRDRKTYMYAVLAAFLLTYIYAATPSSDFPTNTIISVKEGASLQILTNKLKENHVIGSPFWFRTAAIVLGGERSMKAGDYSLPKPQNNFVIAWRIFHGDFGLKTIRVTIPEGYTVKDISKLMDKRFPLFDNSLFLKIARQGYLFPDTYFFEENATATSTIQILEGNFSKQISPFLLEIKRYGRSLEDIIIMASIIEGEAAGSDDRQIISGILWKRLRNNIALQVDVAPETYERRGLPTEPINNPGLLSITAALRPEASPYLYYLHDKDGVIHYARTFDEHKINKLKYLN